MLLGVWEMSGGRFRREICPEVVIHPESLLCRKCDNMQGWSILVILKQGRSGKQAAPCTCALAMQNVLFDFMGMSFCNHFQIITAS
jgi:hypothetical protein